MGNPSRKIKQEYDELLGKYSKARNRIFHAERERDELAAMVGEIKSQLKEETERISLHVMEATERLTKYPSTSLRKRIDGIIRACKFNGFVLDKINCTDSEALQRIKDEAKVEGIEWAAGVVCSSCSPEFSRMSQLASPGAHGDKFFHRFTDGTASGCVATGLHEEVSRLKSQSSPGQKREGE